MITGKGGAEERVCARWSVLCGLCSGGVDDFDTEAAETLALALDLDHLEAADLAGGGHVRPAVGLGVEADDVHDAIIPRRPINQPPR